MSSRPCRPFRLIGVASDAGMPGSGSRWGPAALFAAGLGHAVRRACDEAGSFRWIEPPGNASLNSVLTSVAEACAQALRDGARPLVIGGDHSIAAGTWRGVGRHLGRPPGLIWIDAHLDAHTPASSPSGNPHGMPLAALLGLGHPAMTAIPGPPLDPARIVVIGARSWEFPERERLTGMGVTVVTMAEVAAQGLAECLYAAHRQMGGLAWGMSIDIDAFDPAWAPGVSTPVRGGLSPPAFMAPFTTLCSDPACVALELMEYNPLRDPAGGTARLALSLLDHALR